MSATRRPQWLPVVTALMHSEKKILVGQRPSGQSMPGVWEFPGGKIESGESPEEALKRELQEELGIEAEIGSLALAATHSYGSTNIVLLFYHVFYWKGEVQSVHHSKIQWLTPQELERLPLPEANKKLLPRILKSFTDQNAHRVSV
jgi:8-oxo-dGTP diphosphatase